MILAELYCDGASSGNPGKAGIGVVLVTEGRTHEISAGIGTATNNVAEYQALLRGLEKAHELKVENVNIFLDSELLVKQIQGTYRVKNEHLKKLYDKAVAQLRSFKTFSIQHIPREQNSKADKLAKNAVKTA